MFTSLIWNNDTQKLHFGIVYQRGLQQTRKDAGHFIGDNRQKLTLPESNDNLTNWHKKRAALQPFLLGNQI